MGDFLETLWTDVINIDPNGKWISRVGKTPAGIAQHYHQCAPAIDRLQKLGSALDLGRVSRFVRFETVLEILYSFEDPGVPKGTSLDPEPLIAAAFSGKKPSKKIAEFIESLRETLDTEDDGEWLLGLIDQKNPWLKETGAAVKRLTRAGASTSDLGQLAVWSTYEAVASTLRIIHEAGLTFPDDTDGLTELLQSADPSGKEGGPGSWPIETEKTSKRSETNPLSSPNEERAGERSSSARSKLTKCDARSKNDPLWRIRSGQTVAFSPDSKLLAVGSASGPARIFDALTGKELVTYEGIKAHIYRLAFSPDGQRLAVADIDKRLDICDAKTGKLLAKVTFPINEISGLAYNPVTDDLVRSAWTRNIEILDGVTGKKKEPLTVDPKANMVEAIQFSADGKKLMATWTPLAAEVGQVKLWSWPDRKVISSFSANYHSVADVALSTEGLLAISTSKTYDNKEPGIRIFDIASGKEITRVPTEEPRNLVFLPDGTLVVYNAESLLFLESKAWKKLREIKDVGDVYDLIVSPDGKLLATAGSGVRVWRV